MRTALLVLLLAFLCYPAPSVSDFDEAAFTLNVKWNDFLRTLYGCPVTAVEVSQCKIEKGVMDYKKYFAARKAAKKFFDLEDRDAVTKGKEEHRAECK